MQVEVKGIWERGEGCLTAGSAFNSQNISLRWEQIPCVKGAESSWQRRTSQLEKQLETIIGFHAR